MNKREDFYKWNIEELSKLEKVYNGALRVNSLTSFKGYETITVEEHATGYYYIFEGMRTIVKQFVNGLGQLITKPRGSKSISSIVFSSGSYSGKVLRQEFIKVR